MLGHYLVFRSSSRGREPPDPRDELDEEGWVNRGRKRTQRSIRDRHAASRASGSWKGESDLTAKQTEG